MRTDKIELLVNEAHAIFNATSVFEVIDIDHQAARDFLNKTYNNPRAGVVDQYLNVVRKHRKVTG